MQITIVGAGAIGGIVGAHAIQAGHDVTFVETRADHVEAIRKNGLRISGAADFRVFPKVLFPDEVVGPLDNVLLAVKSRHTHEAMKQIAPHIDENGYVLSLQNGFEEYKIAAAVGGQRTVGAFLTFGGHYVQPGEVAFGGPGSFLIGEMNGDTTPRVLQLQEVLSALQPVQVTDNVFGFLWGKGALGAFYFATALVDADVTDIIKVGRYNKMLGNLVAEVVAVATACDVRCEVIDGFDPNAFASRELDEDAIQSCWDAQIRYWNSHVQQRTGVWRDLAIFQRPTEVDEIIQPIAQRGIEHGVTVPRLQRLVRLIHEAENGLRPLSYANLDDLVALDNQLVRQQMD